MVVRLRCFLGNDFVIVTTKFTSNVTFDGVTAVGIAYSLALVDLCD